MPYVAPFGTYQCTYSNFPGIFTGTMATWDFNGWTVNGITSPAGVGGNYNAIPGGFKWSSGWFTCKWRKVS